MPFKVLLLAVISFVTVTTVFCASDETLEVLEGKTKTFKEQEASGDKSVSGIDSDTELLPGKDLSDEDEEKSEDIRFRSRGGFHRNRFPDYPDYGIIPHGTVRTRVTVQKRILRPRHRAPLPVPLAPAGVVHGNSGGFEGSYVAVSGRPGERTIHAVNGRGSVSIQPRGPTVVRPSHRLPGSSLDYDSFLFDDGFSDGAGSGFLGGEILPKCSYWNTEFRGDDVGDGRGLTAGSAYACKQACIDQDSCQYWTYRRGWARDCYLKRRDGDGRPNARPNRRFVSGTLSNNCDCLRYNGDSICPTRRRGGSFIPWRRGGIRNNNRNRGGARFDYDDDYDYDFYDNDDDRRDIDDDRRRDDERRRDDDDEDVDEDDGEGGVRSRTTTSRRRNTSRRRTTSRRTGGRTSSRRNRTRTRTRDRDGDDDDVEVKK